MSDLDALLHEELELAVAGYSTAATLRRALHIRPEVLSVREAIKSGSLSYESVKDWLGELMADFRQGERFLHEIALLGLLVAIEPVPDLRYDEIIRELANLRVAEMPLSRRVARMSLAWRERKVPFSQITRRTIDSTAHSRTQLREYTPRPVDVEDSRTSALVSA